MSITHEVKSFSKSENRMVSLSSYRQGRRATNFVQGLLAFAFHGPMLLSIRRDGVRGCFCQEDCISCSTLCCRGVRPTLHGTVDPKLPTETEVLEEATHDYERKSDEKVERDLVLGVIGLERRQPRPLASNRSIGNRLGVTARHRWK